MSLTLSVSGSGITFKSNSVGRKWPSSIFSGVTLKW